MSGLLVPAGGRRGTRRTVSEAEMPHAWRANNPVSVHSLARLAIPFWSVGLGAGPGAAGVGGRVAHRGSSFRFYIVDYH
jgi:hypothetical protein